MGKSKKKPSGSSPKVSKEKQADPHNLNTKTKQLKDWYLEFTTWLRKSPRIAGIKKHFAQMGIEGSKPKMLPKMQKI